VVDPAESSCLLEGDDVLGVFNHADQTSIAAGVAADRASLMRGQVAANRAEADPGLDHGQGVKEVAGRGLIRLQEVKQNPLGGAGSDPGTFGINIG
jgi:hypothetical protein